MTSTTSTVYVPIYKVSLEYLVKQGRSWSALEHGILWQLTRQSSDASELARITSMPVRLIVEALIELIASGWVEIATTNTGANFAATSQGKRVAEQRTLPETPRRQRRRTTLCLDRVSNCFFKPEDLNLIHSDDLPSDAAIIPARYYKLVMSAFNSLDHLYLREDESFEEWIDYRVVSQKFYAAVSQIGETLDGLPEYAPDELRSAIFENAAPVIAPSGAQASGNFHSWLPNENRTCRFDFDPHDIIVGGPQHLDLLRRMLLEAKSFMVLHSCFLHPDAIQLLLPSLKAAALRGVTIDLLWGQRNDSLEPWAQAAFREVQSIFENLPSSLRTKLRFARHETGSHAKLILSDSGARGALEAVIGSCNWLSSRYQSIEASVVIREPWLIGVIATTLASLRLPSLGGWTPDVYELINLMQRCRKGGRPSRGQNEGRILLDAEHLGALREARDNASETILAGCDIIGPAGETSVFVPMRTAARDGVKVRLLYSSIAKTLNEAIVESKRRELISLGVEIEGYENLHAKFLSWDDNTLVISSFNWLATTPDPWKPKGAEVGIAITGSNVGSFFAELFGAEVARLRHHV